MVEVVVVGVGVQVGEGHAVQLGVGQGVHDVRLEVLDILNEEVVITDHSSEKVREKLKLRGGRGKLCSVTVYGA